MKRATEQEFLRLNREAFMMPRLMYTPETIVVDLVYPDVAYNRNNVASTFVSWRYRANSIFDPDPALGSGFVPGYTFYSGAYSIYTVLSIGYDISISNMENMPVDVLVWPSIVDLGLNYAGIGEMFGNPHAAQSQIAAKGGQDRCRLRGIVDLGVSYGQIGQYLGGNFSAKFGSNPPGLIFLNVGGIAATNFTATNGLDVRVSLVYRVALGGRLTQVT